jgi:K+-transporting ATPase ATPase A chain
MAAPSLAWALILYFTTSHLHSPCSRAASLVIVPVLAVAGSLAAQRVIPRSTGTLPTDRALFVFFLLGVIVIVGGLTYLPALALGPIIEHLQMLGGALR